MPETKYDRETNRFNCLGIDANRPVDSVKQDKFPFLQNMRTEEGMPSKPRVALTKINSAVAEQSPVHSIRSIYDPSISSWKRIIGTGTHLAVGQTTFTDTDSGYSGNPLALVPYRPDQS